MGRKQLNRNFERVGRQAEVVDRQRERERERERERGLPGMILERA
jgi:hypothetical protein